MTKVRAGAVVFATGVIEQPAVFRNNDLPGVLLGSAAQRLLRRYGIAPGKRVAILTANREGYELARELRAHGIEIAAVLDLRAGFGGDAYGLGDLRCVAGVVPEAAIAGADGAVRALRVRVTGDEARPGAAETIACDAVLMSVGFAPASGLLSQAGAVMQYDMALQQHLPAKLPPGVFAAGRVNGVYDHAARRQDGRDAGAEAAAHARGGHVGERASAAESTRARCRIRIRYFRIRRRETSSISTRTSRSRICWRARRKASTAPELMKRFSTLGMGPSQGKHSNLHGARILMRSRDATLADTALTTQRPFYHPVPLKHLAGMGFHPHRHSAVHEKHAALDASFMTVGGWQRPEYYRVAGSIACGLHRRRSARGARARGPHRRVHARQDRNLRPRRRRVSRSHLYRQLLRPARRHDAVWAVAG